MIAAMKKSDGSDDKFIFKVFIAETVF